MDPYVEHDSLTILLDLILLKRGVYRHLLYNRGAKPRRLVANAQDSDGKQIDSTRRERVMLYFVFNMKFAQFFLGPLASDISAGQHVNIP